MTGTATLDINTPDDQAPQGIDTLRALQALAAADNIALDLKDADLGAMGARVIEHFDLDLGSMSEWLEASEAALELASMAKSAKEYPWSDAANVKYPLIMSAALQYNARAYPAIVPSTDVVKVAVHGDDRDGLKAQRAERVAGFMSWQLKTDSREWEKGTDTLLVQLPIVGDAFRKLWFDPVTERIRSQIRMPGRHIVVDNNSPSLGEAPRVSDQIDIYHHVLETYFRTGRFRRIKLAPPEPDKLTERFIEQLCRYDIDGDGYDEPYIITVHHETQQVVRIVAAFDMDSVMVSPEGQVVSAEVVPYLVHYNMIPSPDGTLLGLGIGSLLADISETVNSTLNLIMDGAHLNSLGGGFIAAQNFRIKGGVNILRPGEWKNVNFTGDDIRKGMVPMNYGEPSPVLFQMLGMLIDAGREIASVSNVMTGDVQRQNMPVGTVMALIEQGMTVFTASYKRIFRALTNEFEMVARFNARYLSPQRYNSWLDGEMPFDPRAEFNLSDMDISPVADPKAVTSMQKMARAQFILDLAQNGQVDPMEAIRRVLEAAAIEDVESLMPKPDPMAAAMAQAQQEMMVLDIRMKDAELDDMMADTLRKLAAAQKDMTEVELAPMRAKVEQIKQWKESLSANRERLGGMAGKQGDAGDSPRAASSGQ